MKPFLILQLRPEDAASDSEFKAFLKAGNMHEEQTRRIRMEQKGIPDIKLEDYSAVIVGGGPYCVSSKNKDTAQKRVESQLEPLMDEIIGKDFPFLGACYGFSLLVQHQGGKISTEKYSEPAVEATTIHLSEHAHDDPLTTELPKNFRAYGGHKEAAQDIPENAVLLAGSETCPVQMIRVKNNIYGTQFHPELDSDGIALRINVYRHAGYFPPEDADKLIAKAMEETVAIPEKIFERFITRYLAIQN